MFSCFIEWVIVALPGLLWYWLCLCVNSLSRKGVIPPCCLFLEVPKLGLTCISVFASHWGRACKYVQYVFVRLLHGSQHVAVVQACGVVLWARVEFYISAE